MEQNSYFSHGKLLISAEYVVLDGALALAVPTRQGQRLTVKKKYGRGRLLWRAYHPSGLWLEVELDLVLNKVLRANLPQSAEFVLKIILKLKELAADIFPSDIDFEITTHLDFPPDYGFGSSSTLMTNLAMWAEVDAYQLNAEVLGGSGYDIAVAQQGKSLFYQSLSGKPKIEPCYFHPFFEKDLLLVHLGQKQDSRKGIQSYRGKKRDDDLIQEISELTRQIAKAQTLETFSDLMNVHENLISKHLDLIPVKEKYFPSCPSFVKSLGAWGGDFVLSSKFPRYQEYFSERGFHTVLDYDKTVF